MSFNDVLDLAREMLDVEELPESLEYRLNRVDTFIKRTRDDGVISRQIVAVIVEQWERDEN